MAVRINVCVERAEPLSGHATKEAEDRTDERTEPMLFEGWLGLLRVLSELLATAGGDRE